jgi:hypothetical protein
MNWDELDHDVKFVCEYSREELENYALSFTDDEKSIWNSLKEGKPFNFYVRNNLDNQKEK